MKEAAFLGIHALLLLAALLRQRELEKAAQQFKQRDEQTNDCDDGLQDIAAALLLNHRPPRRSRGQRGMSIDELSRLQVAGRSKGTAKRERLLL